MFIFSKMISGLEIDVIRHCKMEPCLIENVLINYEFQLQGNDHPTWIYCDIHVKRYVKAKFTETMKLLNNATSDCSFVHVSPIFTIFGSLVNNERVDVTWFWLPWKPFYQDICYHIYQNRYHGVKLAGTGRIQGMIDHWKADAFSILINIVR